ncbi:MAG TPA: cytochrome C oxidase subunit IV family protein [Candidatus Binataceae bacterium]|nr:cytochrome C oxidase subunit IV family protein [Candidatus Binataceae bacterium]
MHQEHVGPSYVAIFIYLAILTGAELVVYALGFSQVLKIGLLVALALAKATLVAMYFMHLAFERRGLWIIAGTPLILVAFCYFMLRPDLSHRSWAHHDEAQVVGEHEHPSPLSPEARGLPPQQGGADAQH